MRILLACGACLRQYDASQRLVGSRFRCSCGELIVVPSIKAHDAAVVRCSSCGGVRQEKQEACRYCGVDFTLHERDLDTICPTCATRISHRARFCHSCATPIVPGADPGETTNYVCPACTDLQLNSSALSDDRVSTLECGRCGGFWLDNRVFRLLEERAQATAVSGDSFRGNGVNQPTSSAAKHQRGPFYRACPVCTTRMHRRHYGSRSGVVVDTCRDHGIWLDFGELDTILRWIKAGGLSDARKWERRRHKEQASIERLRDNIDKCRETVSPPSPPPPLPSVDIVDTILRYFAR